MNVHPLGAVLADVAEGVFPPADGATEVLSSPPGRCDAVVAFTAHHLVAADVSEDEVAGALGDEEIGAPMRASFLCWLADRVGTSAGSLDVLLCARHIPGLAGTQLVPRDDLMGHPRVARARDYREITALYSDLDERAVVILGRGLAGRLEVSIEVAEGHRGGGLARALLMSVRAGLPDDEGLFASVAPGNSASLRAFLAAGFQPVGAEVLFRHGVRDVAPSTTSARRPVDGSATSDQAGVSR
jgi:hypothetical protein